MQLPLPTLYNPNAPAPSIFLMDRHRRTEEHGATGGWGGGGVLQ